ncbi:hypothetical protein THUN1379_24370 [Paludibacterium sp. THUN1379]|uniref:hypothetical protein n=1 Tax=Paludibacterium sp. THUN1379 TaxID=3112107 RepID=UPI00308EB8FA|nr:hypothetical protein THUN1379_24370 [Paludibacterium sp. THUN1379]
MMKNIARHTLYGWRLWEYVERERHRIGTRQVERWHLSDMHSQRRINYLARWLASHVAKQCRNGHVTVSSQWIDQYPQAHSHYQLPGSPAPHTVSVELADLLLLVQVVNQQQTTISERAALLQAKCCQRPDALDPPHDTSTLKERNLLEACCAPLRVTRDSGSTAAPINPAHAQYDLGATPQTPGLKPYARYLLIPLGKLPRTLPYQLLWPSQLHAGQGPMLHLAEAILAMTGLGLPTHYAGHPLNPPGAATDWDHLVRDLIQYCTRQPNLNRFASQTQRTIPREVYARYDLGQISPLRTIVRALLSKGLQMSGLERWLQMTAIPAGPRLPPPVPTPDSEAPSGGFTVLTVRIQVDGPLSPRAD